MRRKRFQKAAAVILSAALVLPSAAQAEAVRAAQVEVMSDGFDTDVEETEAEVVSGTVPETRETSAEEIEVFTDEEMEETAGASSESGGKNRSMEVFSDGTNAVSVAEVQAQINALPTVDEAAFMSGEMLAKAYEQVQSTYDIYMALTEEQKAEIAGAEAFESLFAVFNGMINTLGTVGAFEVTGGTLGTDYSYSNGVLTVNGGANITISMANGATKPTNDRIVVNGDAEITLNGVNIVGSEGNNISGSPQSSIDLLPNAKLTLNIVKQSRNTLVGGRGLDGFEGASGIHVPNSATLIIQGSGSLSVTGGSSNVSYGGVGIGGKVGELGTTGYAPGEACGTVLIFSTGTTSITGGQSMPGSPDADDIGGGRGSLDGSDGQGIKPVHGENNTYEIWGNLTLPEGVTIPEGAKLTGSGTLTEGSRLDQSAPSAPTLNTQTSTSVTLKAPSDTISGKTVQYGYTTGKETSVPDDRWQNSTEFKTLLSNTNYIFYARYAGDNKFYNPSVPSPGLNVTTLKEASTVTVTVKKGDSPITDASYNDSITITAAVAKANANATTRAALDQVEFFVGTGDNKKSLGTADVTSGEAALSMKLSDGEWKKGWVIGINTITAEYGGSSTLEGNSGTATLTVNAAPLSAPQNLTLTSSAPGKATAKWEAVANASGYDLQLYRNGVAQGTVVSATETTCDFTITEAGIYRFKVLAKGSGNYADSQAVESSVLVFYDVTFDADGGGSTDKQIVAAGNKIEEPKEPVKTGYTFAGWYKEESFSNGWNFVTDTISQSTTLYAKWNRNAGTIEPKFVRYIVEHYKEKADGTYELEDTDRPIGTIGVTVTASPKSTYVGYTYNAEKSKDSASGKLNEIKNENDILTLKLYYDLTDYTVTVKTDGEGTASASSNSATMGETITLKHEAGNDTHFVRWEIVPANVTIKDNSFTMPAENVTVKAFFEAHSYGGWESNQDGTHKGTCSCGAEKTFDCTYDENGTCTACGYERIAITT